MHSTWVVVGRREITTGGSYLCSFSVVMRATLLLLLCVRIIRADANKLQRNRAQLYYFGYSKARFPKAHFEVNPLRDSPSQSSVDRHESKLFWPPGPLRPVSRSGFRTPLATPAQLAASNDFATRLSTTFERNAALSAAPSEKARGTREGWKQARNVAAISFKSLSSVARHI